MDRKKTKLIYKILIVTGILLVTHGGVFIYGRYSTENQPTKHVRQLRGELDSSLTANGILLETNEQLETTNRELRDANREGGRILDGIRSSVEELEEGIKESGNILDECIKFVQKLREIDSQTEEE